VPFIGAEGVRDGQTMEGNDRQQWSTMKVVEAAVSRGISRVMMKWGSGALTILGAEGGGAPGGGTRACEAAVAVPAGWPGRNTVGRGRLAGPAKGRGPVAVGGGGPKGGERIMGRPGLKERRDAGGSNPGPGQNSKEIVFEFQLILEFDRTLKIA
jgi:hypothetical protein